MLEMIEAYFAGDERITRKKALKSDGLFCNGKMFVFISDDGPVLKLPIELVDTLVFEGKGVRFKRGNTVLNNWITLHDIGNLEPQLVARVAANHVAK
jgi:TfoX/Sxy family transcriptional regulator of competence genes